MKGIVVLRGQPIRGVEDLDLFFGEIIKEGDCCIAGQELFFFSGERQAGKVTLTRNYPIYAE